jgi:phosphatidylglycerophosphate synthase
MDSTTAINNSNGDVSRRPIKARGTSWAASVAKTLQGAGVTPNQVSVMSAVWSCLGAALMVASPNAAMLVKSGLLIGTGFCIQMRLLCNLFDGMIAIEGGKKSVVGELFNEFPDRISDSVLLVAAGYVADSAELGWLCALLAMGTAYVRAFGAHLTGKQDFAGPMAKQHRMFVLTVALLVSALLGALQYPDYALFVGLVVIAIGSAFTCAHRVLHLVSELNTRDLN